MESTRGGDHERGETFVNGRMLDRFWEGCGANGPLRLDVDRGNGQAMEQVAASAAVCGDWS